MVRFKPTCDQDYLDHWNSRSVILENGCRQWTGPAKGTSSKLRYADVGYRGKRMTVHRAVYTLTKGPIPEGQVVRHNCDNSLCINPDHLLLGTQYENCQDAKERGRYWHHESRFPACKRGHEFTAENTRICKQGFRHCLQCEKDRFATPEYRAQRAEYHRQKRLRNKLNAMSEGEDRG